LPILPVRKSRIDSNKRREIELIKFHVRWLDQVWSSDMETWIYLFTGLT
jgi:hypothetical protein